MRNGSLMALLYAVPRYGTSFSFDSPGYSSPLYHYTTMTYKVYFCGGLTL